MLHLEKMRKDCCVTKSRSDSKSKLTRWKEFLAAPVFFRVDVSEVDRAVAVDNVDVGLRRELRQQVDNVADSAAVDHHDTPYVLIALQA